MLRNDCPILGPIHDLTQTLSSGSPAFPGDPAIRVESWPDALPWHVTALSLGSHAGTHLDAPRHLFPDGVGIDAYPPARWFGPGIVVDLPGLHDDEAIAPASLAAHRSLLRPGWFVLLRTGWDRWWGDDRYWRHPYVTEELATVLVEAGVGLVGIDAPSVDSTTAGGTASHHRLLGADIPIAENLRGLTALAVGRPYLIVVAPLALVDADAAPARAFAWPLAAEPHPNTR